MKRKYTKKRVCIEASKWGITWERGRGCLGVAGGDPAGSAGALQTLVPRRAGELPGGAFQVETVRRLSDHSHIWIYWNKILTASATLGMN